MSKTLIEFTEKQVQSCIYSHWQKAAITSDFLVFACNIHVPQEANQYQCSPLTEHASLTLKMPILKC